MTTAFTDTSFFRDWTGDRTAPWYVSSRAGTGKTAALATWWTLCGTSNSRAISCELRGDLFSVLAETNTWTAIQRVPIASAAIAEIRQKSQLTWEQLARIFSVQRRSLHFWAKGSRPSFDNAKRLERVRAIVREIDRGTPDVNRALLLRPFAGTDSIYDMLCVGRDEEVLGALKRDDDAPTPSLSERRSHQRRPPRIDASERQHRRALPPAELLEARHDDAPLTRRRLVGAVPLPTFRT